MNAIEKALHVMIPAELHKWLKMRSVEKSEPLKEVVILALEQYRRSVEQAGK